MSLDKLIVIKKYRLRSYINIVINYSTNKKPTRVGLSSSMKLFLFSYPSKIMI